MRIPIGLAAVAVLAWWLVLDPLRADITARGEQLARAEMDLTRLAPSSSVLETAERDVDRLERAVAAARVSQEPLDANGVLARLHAAAADAQVEVVSVRPRAPSGSGPGGVPPGPEQMSFDVGVSGPFSDMHRFLAALASSRVVITTPDLKLSRRAGPDSSGHLAASLVVVAHAIAPPDAAAAADEQAGDLGRDPFDSPASARATAPTAVPGATGLAGVAVSAVTVKGVARRGSTRLAILETADRRSFVVRARDRLADGVVEDIDVAGVVFAQTDAGSRTALVRKAVAREGARR